VIPRADVEIRWDVDYATIRPPSFEDIAYGGSATRGYAGLLVVTATWNDAVECLSYEREAVARLGAAADDADVFDELAQDEEAEATLWDPEEGPVAAPDLGMFAACTALCAAGCATAASCRGHPDDYAWSSKPLILFSADAVRARLIEPVARASDCGLFSTDNGKLGLYAQSIEEVLAFAALMIERRDTFAALALPPELAARRGVEAPDVPDGLPSQTTLF
jgi:hypothetical protein